MALDGGPPLNAESHSWKMRLRADSLSVPGAVPHAIAASGGFLSLRGALHRKARRCRFGLASGGDRLGLRRPLEEPPIGRLIIGHDSLIALETRTQQSLEGPRSSPLVSGLGRP